MPELRWTLLVLGVLFLAGLAAWEARRGRRARAADLARLGSGPPVAEREHLHADEPADMPLPSFSARDPEREPASRPLPVFELPARGGGEAGRRLDPILDFADEPLVTDGAEPSISGLETTAPQPAARGAAAPAAQPEFDELDVGPVRVIDSPTLAPPAAVAPATLTPVPDRVPAAAPAAGLPADPAGLPAEPIVDWPDPAESRIVSVRIVAPREKFQGRAVRLALTAQGFVLGKFSIYHKPAHDGRALLSVASLTKPGTFDAARVDMQRFGGLSLFTVLPGPVPAADAIDELLHCAGVLSARLHGVLQDDQGEPLSGSRAALLRAAAAAPAPAP